MLSQSIQSKPGFKLSVLFRLAALVVLTCAHRGEAATNQVVEPVSYCFMQNSRESSRNVVFATKTAVKIRGLKHKITMIAKAPDWTVYIFREESKKICVKPFNSFNGGFRIALSITGEPIFSPADFAKSGSGKVSEIPVDWYKTNQSYADREFNSYKRGETMGTAPMNVQYAVATSLGLPKQVAWLMQRFYGCPKNDSAPLALKYECCDHSQINKITTISVTHQQFVPSDFQVPTHGFTKVETEMEVLLDKKMTTNADEIMTTFGKFEQ